MKIKISDIKVGENRRAIDEANVRTLMNSIKEVGLISPIAVTVSNLLIAGAHRLEACRRIGMEKIECNVIEIDGLKAELAEIDENLVRHNLNHIDEGEQLLRKKEIYEVLYPETKKGAVNQYTKVLMAEDAVSNQKSFVDDTASKMQIAPRTIRNKIQVAKSLSPEVKAIVRENGISEKSSIQLARIKEPGKQKEAAEMLLSKSNQSNDRSKPSFKSIVADLKSSEKDMSITPELFMMEYQAFTEEMVHRFEWYKQEMYMSLYPTLSESEQKKLTAFNTAMSKAAEKINEIQRGNLK